MGQLRKLLGFELELGVGKIEVGFATHRNHVNVRVRNLKSKDAQPNSIAGNDRFLGLGHRPNQFKNRLVVFFRKLKKAVNFSFGNDQSVPLT